MMKQIIQSVTGWYIKHALSGIQKYVRGSEVIHEMSNMIFLSCLVDGKPFEIWKLAMLKGVISSWINISLFYGLLIVYLLYLHLKQHSVALKPLEIDTSIFYLQFCSQWPVSGSTEPTCTDRLLQPLNDSQTSIYIPTQVNEVA